MQKPLKVVLISLLAATIIGGGIYVYFKLIKGGATASAKRNRRIVFRKTNISNATGSLITANDSIIDVPSLPQAFFNNTQIATVRLKLATIENKYGDYINAISKMSNVNPEIIKSFIFVESSGNPDVIGGISVGLMQVNPTTATDVIKMEYSKGRLNDKEKAIIKKYLGNNVNFSNAKVTTADLKKPEFNILIGTLYIGILIDEETTTKVVDISGYSNDWQKGQVNPEYKSQKIVRLDYVIARYNQGYYKFKIANKPSGTVSEVCNKVGTTTCSYIKKIMGENGTLTLLV